MRVKMLQGKDTGSIVDLPKVAAEIELQFGNAELAPEESEVVEAKKPVKKTAKKATTPAKSKGKKATNNALFPKTKRSTNR
jgi:hypothetical protein